MESRTLPCIAAAVFVGSMLVLGATGVAHAQAPVIVQGKLHIDPETQRVVPYGDLNLADSNAQKVLVRRVGYAVDDLCDAHPFEHRDFERWGQIRYCRTAAWNSANPQIAAAIQQAQSGTFMAAAVLTISEQR